MARELKIYGRTYELTIGVENYAKVREEFEELAWNYGKLYVKDIEKPGLSMAALIKNGYEAAEKYFEKAADDVLDRLAEHGVYTVKHQDIERMAEQYGVLDAFDKGFHAVAEAYYKIVGRAEEEKLQRQIRKESRGRVVGGGFGLKGAAQGMIQAGLLNGVTGLGHSIFNAIGNARTEREKRERLDALYPVAYGVLQNAFKASVSNYYLLLVSLLDEFGIFEFELPAEQDKELAKALLENLSAGRVPKDMSDEILYEIVTLNPYQIESYEYILENYGDKKNELEKFAKAHGISIASIKDVIFDDMFYSDVMDLCNDDEIKKDPVKYEKKLVALQNKMEKQKKKMSFAGETECDGIIKKELKTLGEKYKTIDGVVFQTMGEVKAARKDLKTFYDYISIHGIESESLHEEITQLEFETDIVTANLDERLQEMKKLTNDGFLGNCVGKAFNRNGFSLSVHSDSSFAEKVSVIGVSRNFAAVAEIARDLAKISENEKIVLIFRNETWSANGFLWCVLTNENLYMFESKGDAVEKKKVVPFLSIESVHADWQGNLVTSIKDEVDRTDKMELGNEFREDVVQEKFSRAMEEILHLIAPLTKGRLTAKEMARKQEKKEQFEREIAEATDITKAKKVVKAINSDKILGEEEKNAFLAKAQQRLDKYQNAETNARELKQMVSAIGKNDLTGINNALNKLLKSDLYDDSDKKAITDLIEMQLEFGSKWYAKELNNFFDQNRASSHLIQGKPVYMKKNSEETAGKLCDFFIRISPELEKGEVPLVFFKNDRGRPLPPAPPYAEEGMISNRRVFISFWGNGYKVFELNNLEINQMFLEQGYKVRANGELLSFGFPYVKLEEITDKTYRRKLKSALGERESVVVAAELNRFITGVMERNAEIKTGMARPVELPKASVVSKPAAGETPKPRVAETPKPSAEETARPLKVEQVPKAVGAEKKEETKVSVKKEKTENDRRAERLIETADKMISFIRPRLTALTERLVRFEPKIAIGLAVKKQTGTDADALVCTIGTGPDACRLFIKKVVCGNRSLRWDEIYRFEAKKKLFKSFLNCSCRVGADVQVDVQISGITLEKIAMLLTEVVSYMKNLPLYNEAEEGGTTGGIVSKETNKVPHPMAASGMSNAIMPLIEAHISQIKDEIVSYRVMKWDGDPTVMRGEKEPILVVMQNMLCSPKQMGDEAIKAEAGRVLGLLTDFFYIVNSEKFILYVQGQKYEWKISVLERLAFEWKASLLSDLYVTDAIGRQTKIQISRRFQKHVEGLNRILAFLRKQK